MILAFSLQMVSQILVKMAAATKTERQHCFVMYYNYCLGLMFFGLQMASQVLAKMAVFTKNRTLC
jgi:hypothetical protein